MAATPAQLIPQLATLLGLDDTSVKEQVWPYLSSMKTVQEVAPYLSVRSARPTSCPSAPKLRSNRKLTLLA